MARSEAPTIAGVVGANVASFWSSVLEPMTQGGVLLLTLGAAYYLFRNRRMDYKNKQLEHQIKEKQLEQLSREAE